MRRKARAVSGQVVARRAAAASRSIRAFDDAYTAPYHGSAMPPTTTIARAPCGSSTGSASRRSIITAADDPFVPPGPFSDPAVAGNRNITVKLTPHGGHCGFVEEREGVRRLLGGAGNHRVCAQALPRLKATRLLKTLLLTI